MIKGRQKNTRKFQNQALVAIVLLGTFLGLMAIRKQPKHPPRIYPTPSHSKFLFETKNDLFIASFGDKSSSDPIISFSNQKDSSIEFYLQNNTHVKPVSSGNSLIYKDIQHGVDLRYTTLNNGIKEELILNKPAVTNSYSFNLNLKNALPESQTNKIFTGVFSDENGNRLFHFEKPYAIDAKGSRTDNVTNQIKKDPNTGQFIIDLIVDRSWLESDERVYPITIDPTIVVDTTVEFALGYFNRSKDTGSGSSPVVQSYYAELPDEQFTAGLWHLNETSATNAIDASGNSNTGVPTGTQAVSTGILGYARQFSSASDFLTITSPTTHLDGDLTIELWVYPTNIGSGRINFIDKNYANEFGTTLETNGSLSYYHGSGGTYMGWTPLPAGSLVNNTWAHVAIVRDSSSKSLTSYLNGKYTASTVYTIAPSISASPIYIGKGYAGSFAGKIDEVRISTTAKSEEQIRLDANIRPYSTYTSNVLDLTNPLSFSPLIWSAFGVATGNGETIVSTASSDASGKWDFNATSGTTAVNTGSCGATCNATLVNFANTTGQDLVNVSGWTSNNRRWGAGAINFDGVNDYVSVPDNNQLDADIDRSFTYEAWFNTFKIGSYQNIIRKDNLNMGGTRTYLILRIDSDNHPAFYVNDGAAGGLAKSTRYFNDGYWHHIVGVRDVDTDTIKLYVDGKLEASVNDASTAALANNAPVVFGCSYNNGTTSEYFQGSIDSPRIYPITALTASEILSNYNSGRVELQTRVGATTNPDDGTWEAWRPTTGETLVNTLESAAVLPSAISGLVSWVKADAITGVANGAQFGTWTDSSGNGNHFTQATGTKQPTYHTGVINGLPVVRVAAATLQTMTVTTNFVTPTTVIYVGRLIGGANYRMLTANSNNWLLGFHGGHKRQFYAEGWNTPTTLPTDYNWHIYESVQSTTESHAWEDGSMFVNGSVTGKTGPNGLTLSGYAGSQFSNGEIAEIIVYNRAISETERRTVENYLADKYNLNIGVSIRSKTDTAFKIEGAGSTRLTNNRLQADGSTVGLWHLEETSGTGAYLKDSSLNANHGTPAGTSSSDGFSGKARLFNGTSESITPGVTNLPTVNSMYSIEAWVYPTATGSRGIVGWGNYGTTNQANAVRFNGTTQLLHYWWGNDLAVTVGNYLNSWHYIVATFDGTSRKLYYDGQLMGYDSPGAVHNMSNANFKIGVTNSTEFFQGSIDEVRISNVPRTAEEIAETYRNGRNYKVTRPFSSVSGSENLTSITKIPFYIASDRLGTFSEIIIGETLYGNGDSDINTLGYWQLEGEVTRVTQPTTPVYFNHTGGAQTYVVPAGVTSIQVKAWGGGGGGGGGGSAGGGGAYASSVISVIPGESLTLYVGGGGGGGNGGCVTGTGGGAGGTSGYGTGGRGGHAGTVGCSRGGGGGGAASYFLRGSTVLVTAAGGGGGAGQESSGAGPGGAGGVNGTNGSCSSIGGTTGASGSINGGQGGDRGAADGSGSGGGGSGSNGGTGGTAPTCDSTGGAGGGGGASVGTTITNGSGVTPGNPDADMGVLYGYGSGASTAGRNGRIAVIPTYDTPNSFRDNSTSNKTAGLGIGYAGNAIATTTFNYTGAAQNYVVPGGVTSVAVKAWGGGGAGGGCGTFGGAGGGGAYSYTILPTTPGETLTVYVGGGGNPGSTTCTAAGGGGVASGGGYGTGGAGGNAGSTGASGGAGSGGAGSFVLRGSTVLMAAGGGGGGGGGEAAGAGAGGGGGVHGANGNCSAIGGYTHASTSQNGGAGGTTTADASGSGGGGGGWLGATGGTVPTCDTYGAGGGGGRSLGLTVANGSGVTPGNSADADRGTAGNGGAAHTAGVTGKVLITSLNNQPTIGKFGKGVFFNPTSMDAVAFPTINVGTNYTIEAWLNFPFLDSAGWRTLFSRNGGTYHYALVQTGTNLLGLWNVSTFYSCGLNVTTVSSGWHHFALVVAAGTGVTQYYLDGLPVCQSAFQIVNQDFGVFGNYSSTSGSQGAGISMDEVRFSNIARSAAEIRQAFEIGSRTHSITFDFKAKLGAGNLIINSGDTSFTIDETAYGSALAASHIFGGEKIIVKENVNGIEYIAQGNVSSVNVSTGAVTVVAWDAGSTFPASGFSVYATVIKWQREFVDISESLVTSRDAASLLTLRLTDGSEGGNVWIDNIQKTTGYLNSPSGSTITSSTGNRYFQYRAIINQNNIFAPSSAIKSLTLTAQTPPQVPTLVNPANGSIDQISRPVFQTYAYDDENDNLRYKIVLCLNAAMTSGCQTFDQTVTQTGWSAAQYASNTTATYTPQYDLDPATTYYWKSYAIDYAGSNTWSGTQITPFSFTTNDASGKPEFPEANTQLTPALIILGTTPFFSAIHADPNGYNAIQYRIEVNTASNFSGTVMWDSGRVSMTSTPVTQRSPNLNYAGSALSTNTTYYWRITFYNTNGFPSPVSDTQTMTTNTIPATPTLITPPDGLANQPIYTIFTLSGTDADSDSLRYFITICTDLAMTTGCRTYEQNLSQSGWSGQNADISSSYASGSTATFTIYDTPLNQNTIYYWTAKSYDPNGSRTYSPVAAVRAFATSRVPNTPTLDSPTDAATAVLLKPVFKTTATDPDADYLRYKIEVCTDLVMTSGCQTFNQTTSQTGWSGQNAQSFSAYTSGTQATYTTQTDLLPNTTYYWRTYAIDPAGSNVWSSTQVTPYSFTTNALPNAPTLDQPINNAVGVTVNTVFKLTATDPNTDYLKYKIILCADVGMAFDCQTFDQTASQTGWSGQNAAGNTAYTSGTQATYSVQVPLNQITAYYWQAYAIDPAGTNSWGSTNIAKKFTTVAGPVTPSECTLTKSTDNTSITVNWTDRSASENGYEIWKMTNSGLPVQLLPNLAADSVTYQDTAVAINNNYAYLVRAFQYDGPATLYSGWCNTSTMNLSTGFFQFERLRMDGVKLD